MVECRDSETISACMATGYGQIHDFGILFPTEEFLTANIADHELKAGLFIQIHLRTS